MAALIVAYRRYKVAESIAALERVNAQLGQIEVYDEQFTAAAAQIDDEKAAIRLAGVRAMAGLADYWPEHRQACVDVLCADLRMPHSPNRSQGAPPEDRLKFDSARDVRDTVLRIITSHLRPGAEVSWRAWILTSPAWRLTMGTFPGSASPVARSASAAPSSPAARSASTARSSPAARSASAARSSPAARSASTAPGSPAGGSAATERSSAGWGP